MQSCQQTKRNSPLIYDDHYHCVSFIEPTYFTGVIPGYVATPKENLLRLVE